MSPTPPPHGDPVADIARAVGTTETLDKLLAATLLEAHEPGPVDPKRVSERSGKEVSVDLVRTVFGRLEQAGALEDDGERVRVERGRLVDLLNSARTVVEARTAIGGEHQELAAEFVCTLPREDPHFEGKHPVDYGFAQITSRLLGLCGRAEESLLLFAPFLEEDGIDWLLPGLAAALQKRVGVQVVTRELEPTTRKYEALRPLLDLADEHGSDLRLYDYFGERPGGGYPLYTLHSKLLIVDRREAYVGSANFTTYGFSEFFEVGVVVEGLAVKQLHDLCTYLLEGSAERVR